ncbi:uncharacterized protein KGF55_004862 [Candida pseudojiufengensis]|uniref:uncharacterized protein n=1 Tax=Candida pseudojiufengensis TaxID=497109 RepID=UPI002223F148|nr:uncharacterized protein KGF55_004862 [Candida pseudojiufengensis]KAI5960139.1 hypothetical protein KGF55_004862 [Candida pseudojiufengensis]
MTSLGMFNSNSSNSNFQPPQNYYNQKSTPLSSPKSLNFAQFTPPPSNHLSNHNSANGGTSTSVMGSPKKLLTPIKNLFSSNKSVTTPSSNDNLQNILQTSSKDSPKDSKSSIFKRHIRSKSNNNIHAHNDFKHLPEDPPIASNTFRVVQPSVSSPSLHELNLMNHGKGSSSNKYRSQQNLHHLQSQQSHSSLRSEINHNMNDGTQDHSYATKIPTSESSNGLGIPITLSNDNFSIPSLPESRNKRSTKDVCFDPALTSSIEDKDELKTDHTSYSNESVEGDDFEYEDDDNTSQFSFVQDMKNGRNTSVKYYKTKTDSNKKQNMTVNKNMAPNSFDENDLGYEDEELSDYDFENNGGVEDMEEYDYEEEFQGENTAYADMFNDNKDQGSEDFADETTPKQSTFRDLETNQMQAETAQDDFELSRIEEEDEYSRSYFLNESSMKIAEPKLSPNSKFNEFTKGLSFPKQSKFNSSLHLSIQGNSLTSSSNSFYSNLDAEDRNEIDILENYLESISNEQPNQEKQFNYDSFISPPLPQDEVFDFLPTSSLNSPIINGLTIGSNLRHRSRDSNKSDNHNNRLIINRDPINIKKEEGNSGLKISDNESIASFHESFDDKLNFKIGEKVEAFTAWQNQVSTQNNNHDSFNENKSYNKQNQTNTNNQDRAGSIEKDDRFNRESILGMMNFLGSVENHSLTTENDKHQGTKFQDHQNLTRFDSILSRNSSQRSYMQKRYNNVLIYNSLFTKSEINLSGEQEKIEKQKSFKRYSWFNNSEELSLHLRPTTNNIEKDFDNKMNLQEPIRFNESQKESSYMNKVDQQSNEFNDYYEDNEFEDQDILDEINQSANYEF